MGRPTDPDRVRRIRIGRDQIESELKEAPIDRLALDFCAALASESVAYAVVGGYVAILLGRPRESDDVDIFAHPMKIGAFRALHRRLSGRFECLTPGNIEILHGDYLDAGSESTSIRYAARGSFVPNIEFKFAKKPLDRRAIARKLDLVLNGQRIHVSPLEMQIAYKLFMASPKDYEDARWIFRVAEDVLDETEIWRVAEALGVSKATGRKVLGIK